MDDNAALFETWDIVREVPIVLPDAEVISMRKLTTVMNMEYEDLRKRSTSFGLWRIFIKSVLERTVGVG